VLSHLPAGVLRASWEDRSVGVESAFPEIVVDESFLEEQVDRIRFMTVSYATLSVLAVLILLVVLWGMLAAARREQKLSELKSRFVANVSHELKTPLAMIKMFSETLQEGRVASQEKADEYYRIISRESTRLSHLIHNMLDFSRIDAGRKQYTMAEVQVGPLVEEAYATHRPELDQLGFEHELHLADDLPAVFGDSESIQQVIHNLIGNAVKYSESDKFIGIDVVRETRRGRVGVLITVKDRGIGIKPAERARLFEGFYRGGDDQVKRRHGTGLGLALVKHIVDAHGGVIDVETRLIKGSAFRVFLPGAKARREGRGNRGEAMGHSE
jgi:signal transduction histidine kinase